MTAVYEAASNLLSYDPDKGHFVWKTNASKTVKGKVAGSKKRDGYVYIQFNGKKLSAHRLAWFVLNGSLPNNLVIDHIDGDCTNNDPKNLDELCPLCHKLKGQLSGDFDRTKHHKVQLAVGSKRKKRTNALTQYQALFGS